MYLSYVTNNIQNFQKIEFPGIAYALSLDHHSQTLAKLPSSQNQRYDSYHHQNSLKPSHRYSKGFCEKNLSISAKMWICIAVKKAKKQTPLSYKYRYS